jgi:hypothetical protein
MKKIIIYAGITLGLSGPFFLTSCKKEDPIKPKTKTELLCSSPWKIYEQTINPGIKIVGGATITDVFAQLDPCDKDDLTLYKSNGSGIYDDGPMKCDPLDLQTSTFTWTFNLDETKLIEDTDSYDIVQLDEKVLKLSIIIDGEDIGGIAGVKYVLTSTSKH